MFSRISLLLSDMTWTGCVKWRVEISSHLTPLSSDLAVKAREFRRQGRLYQTWVYDRKIFILTYKGSRAHVVRDEDDLSQQLAPTVLGAPTGAWNSS